MWSSAPEAQQWVIQPLVDAGLALDQIRVLVFDLAFDGIINDGRATVAGIEAIVRDQPAEVRAAWAETIGRLLALPSARP